MMLLEARGLSRSFGGLRAVDGVSFQLAQGELLALIGPNGAGKTTCFNMLNGNLAPDSGTVWLDGKEITRIPPRHVWRLGVGRTFQITATFQSMTVIENVQMALISHHHRIFNLRAGATSLYTAEAMKLLELTSMAGQAGRAAAELAYGDLKRLELAVALAHSPRLLLMDEPTAGMAPAERAALMSLAASIVDRDGIGVLFTEHDMDVVFSHARRILVLNRGRLIAEGSAEAIRSNPLVREVYLGGGTTFAQAAGERR
ncbi:MAG: ABC transporter ATP-binding protein [Hyphomicrobiaceae bacterium]|nr:MAG: ABC transporter ATP-binding protein [Hyphomicrobiaceae bacterium]